ncbi:g4957 [Coccomyxa elongata]
MQAQDSITRAISHSVAQVKQNESADVAASSAAAEVAKAVAAAYLQAAGNASTQGSVVNPIDSTAIAAAISQAAANSISEAFGKAAYDQLGLTVSTRAEDFQRAFSLAFASVQAFSSTNTGGTEAAGSNGAIVSDKLTKGIGASLAKVLAQISGELELDGGPAGGTRGSSLAVIARNIHSNCATAPQVALESLSFEKLASSITPTSAQALVDKGYVVIDSALDNDACAIFREEIRSLHRSQNLTLNSTHLVRAGERTLLQKQGIYEAEVADQAIQRAAPAIRAFQEDRTLLTMLSLFLPEMRLHSQLTKLQYNAGDGGCFPMHFDSDDSVDARRVTAILYLNFDWRPSHGGELQLFPWPYPPVTIQPLYNRMVIFHATRMLHRVLPSFAERFCLTVWMSVLKPDLPPVPSLLINKGAPKGSHKDLLAQPQVMRALAKVHYKDTWVQSIKDSHPESQARDAMIAQFWKDTHVLEKNLTALGLDTRDVTQNSFIKWF